MIEMTCSTSIVHFNFTINSEIKRNSVDGNTFSSVTSVNESGKNSKIYCTEEIKDSDVLTRKGNAKQMFNNCDQFDISTTDGTTVRRPELNAPTLQSNRTSNMNNGLSNGHALNLDIEQNSETTINPQSKSSFPLVSSEFSSSVNSLHTTSSETDSTDISNRLMMGLLNSHDQECITQNLLLLKNGKFENGQNVGLNSNSEWTDLKPVPNLQNNKVNILPLFDSVDQNSDEIKRNENGDTHKNNDIEHQSSGADLEKVESDNIDSLPSVINKEDSHDDETSQRLDLRFQPCSDTSNLNNLSSPLKLKTEDEKTLEHHLTTPENQELFISTNSVPSNAECNDLSAEQEFLSQHCKDLIKRVRRVQIQQTHRNLTKQMKHFVSRKQKLNSIGCQRFDLDFSPFPHFPPSSSSQLKSYLLQRDSPFVKNERLSKSDSNSTPLFSTIHPNSFNFNNQSHDIFNNQKSNLKKPFNLLPTIPHLSQQFCPPSSDSPLNNYPPFPFPPSIPHFHNNLPLNQDKHSTVYNNVNQKVLSRENKSKILTTIDTLRYNLRHLESKYDSDATDSSSGGESADELEDGELKNSTYSCTELSSTSLSGRKHTPM